MNGGHYALSRPKVKFFIYGAILLKYETQYFHMFTISNWNLDMGVRLLPHPLKKVKFFIYIAILLKFGTEQFNMYNNNNLDYNVEMKLPFPPLLLPSK